MGKTRASLLKRLRDGEDDLAWREFLSTYWRPLYAFARHVGCSAETAEEVTEETIVAVFENRQVFHYDPKRGRFHSWLFTVLRQKLALIRRKDRRGIATDTNPEALPAADPSAELRFEQLFELGLVAAMLEIVKQSVAPSTYQAFHLTAIQGLSIREASRLTGLSRNAVYQSRSHTMARLRELGAQYRDEGELGPQLREMVESFPVRQTEQTLTQSLSRRLGGKAIE